MRRFSISVLIAFLLLAQSALLAHELDLAAHADGHACEYCALTGSLDKPVVGTAMALSAATAVVEINHVLAAVALSTIARFYARAPPRNLLIR